MMNETTKNYKAYCQQCEQDVIICGKCGNNTCNGGYGVLANGETCDECPNAYEQQGLIDHENFLAEQKRVWDKYRDTQ